LLRASGVSSAHWRKGELASRIMRRIWAGQDPIQDFPRTIGFTDMVAVRPGMILEPYKRFDYLHHWYPNALFILNTRDRENWISSRLRHRYRPLGSYAQSLGIRESEVPDYWRAEWVCHHTAVRAYFRDASTFLEFNIEEDDPKKLTAFLAQRYPHCAKTPLGVHNKSEP
jgi:hypothetical protein